MKYCVHCGTELNDDAIFCTNCGEHVGNASEAAPKIKYCTNCGSELKEGADYCLNCGCKVERPEAEQYSNKNRVLEVIAKVFLVLTCVAYGLSALLCVFSSIIIANASSVLTPEELESLIAGSGITSEQFIYVYTMALIAAAITIFILMIVSILLTVIVFKRTKAGAPIPIGIKICILLLVSIISGILLLCRKEPLTSSNY